MVLAFDLPPVVLGLALGIACGLSFLTCPCNSNPG
jgi:hypothetical protein